MLANRAEDDGSRSAHDDAVTRFEQSGYAVCFERVCPTQMGLPMSRDRVHYILLSTRMCRGATEQVKKLSEVWHRVASSSGAYPRKLLTSFLVGNDHAAVMTAALRAQHMAQREIPRKARKESTASSNDALKWKRMHADMFLDYKAGPSAASLC